MTVFAVFIIVYGLAAAAFPYLFARLPIEALLRQQLVGQLEEELGAAVTFEDIKPAGMNRIEITGLKVTQHGSTLMRAAAIQVQVDLARLIVLPWQPIGSLRQITVIEPEIVITRQKDGHWDILSLFEGFSAQGRRSAYFSPLIGLQIRDGRVTVRNWPEGREFSFSDIDGVGQIGRKGFSGRLNGFNSLVEAGPLTVEGFFGWAGSGQPWQLQFRARGVDAKSYDDSRVFPIPEFHLNGGSGDVTVRAAGRGDKVDEYRVTVDVSNGSGLLTFLPHPLRQVNGTLVFDGTSLFLQDLRGLVGDSRLRVVGRVFDWENPKVDLTISAVDGHLEDVKKLLSRWQSPAGTLDIGKLAVTGKVTGELEMVGDPFQPVLGGKLQVEGGEVFLPGLPDRFSNIAGQLTFASSRVIVDLTGGFLGGRTSVSGQISNWRDPLLDLEVKAGFLANRLNQWPLLPSKLPRQLQGEVTVTAEVDGLWTAPLVQGSVSASGLGWPGMIWEDVLVAGSFFNGSISVESLTLVQGDGSVSGSGYLHVPGDRSAGGASLQYGFALTIDRLKIKPWVVDRLERVMGPSSAGAVPAFGPVSGTAMFWGTKLNANALEGSCVLEIDGLAWRKAQFGKVTAGLTVGGGTVKVDYLNLDGPAGRAWVEGEIETDGSLDLAVRTEEVALSDLGLVEGLSGILRFSGQVSGDLFRPAVDGKVSVRSLRYGQYQASKASAKVNWQDGRLDLADGRLGLGEGQFRFSGRVGGRSPVDLDFHFESDGIPLETVLQAAGVEVPASGRLSGTVRLTRKAGELSGLGHVKAYDLSVYGEKVKHVEARARLANSSIMIDHMVAHLLEGTATASGRVDLQDGWDLALHANGIILQGVQKLNSRGFGLKGRVKAQTRVTGPLRSPRLEGSFTGTGINVKGYQFDGVEGHAVYKGQTVVIQSVKLRKGQGQYLASGKLILTGQPNGPELDVRVKLEQASLTNLLSAVDIPRNLGLSGYVNGYAHIWGSVSEPVVRVMVGLDQGVLLDRGLEGDIDVTVESVNISVNRVRLQWGDGLVVGRGRLSPAEKLDLFLRGEKFPLDKVFAQFGLQPDVTGTADWEMVLTGTARKPHLVGIIQLSDATVGTAAVSHGIGAFTLEGSRLQLNEVILETQGHLISAQGSADLPFPWLTRLGVQGVKSRDEAAIGITVSIVPYGLGPQVVIAGGAQIERPRLEGELLFGGHWDRPSLEGTLAAEAAGLAHEVIPDSAKNIRLEASFDQNQLVVRTMTARVGQGWIRSSGKVSLSGLRPTHYDLQFRANELQYASDLLSGRVSGSMRIEGPASLPLVSGQIKVAQGKVQLRAPTSAGFPMDARLDLSVSTTEDVVVQGFGTDLMLAGAAHLGGTLQSPQVDGRLMVTRGTLNFLGTGFEVTSGSVEFSPAQGLIPLLDLRAETILDGANLTLAMRGSANQIETTLRSDPYIPYQELVARLGWPERVQRLLGGDLAGWLNDGMIRMLEWEFASQFVGDLTQTFQAALDLDKLQIRPSVLEKSIRVELGKYVIDDVFVTYSREVNRSARQEVGIEYRLRPSLVIEGKVDSDGNRWLGLKGKFWF